MFRIDHSQALKPSVLSIGNFDGVHQGHQKILAHLVAEAKKLNLQSQVLLFEPHPKEFFLGAVAPKRLQNLRAKVACIKALGVEQIICCHFDEAMAALTPTRFIDEILKQKLHTKALVLGDDFRFGKQRQGKISSLLEAGLSVNTVAAVSYQNRRISSSWLRELILGSHFELAEQLMQHPYTLSGHVVHGAKHGRLLGYPTINLNLTRLMAVHGVYAVRVKLESKHYDGVANVGHRPALNPRNLPLLEVYLFNYQQECYGAIAEVIFVRKLREEQNFANLEALKTQIGEDAQLAQKILQGAPSL